MTAQADALGFGTWGTEGVGLGEAADDSVANRMQLLEPVDVSDFGRPMIERQHLAQRLAEGDSQLLGGYGLKRFRTRHYWYGHGTTTAGALTATPLANLLAHVLGNSYTADNGGVEDGVDGTATELSMDGGSELFVAGSLARVGAQGDGRGNGQFYVVNSPTGTPVVTASLRNAMAAACNDGDVVYAAQLAYPVSTHSSGGIITSSDAARNNSLRWQLGSANEIWAAKGCVAESLGIDIAIGAPATFDIGWLSAFQKPLAGTFPSTDALSCKDPAPVTAGALQIGALDATTRNVVGLRGISIEIGLGVKAIEGDGAQSDGQTVVRYVRVPARTFVEFVFEAEANTATPTWWNYALTNPNSIVHKRAVWTGSMVDGSAIGAHFPNLKPVNVPAQERDGSNLVRARFEALTSALTTSELTLANFVLAMA